ncbi:MAG TPA: hypothetical protein VHG90_10075 [Acidimicrobiales bacterium]|nr:hypothetical protein [Acidimicrobiales bacterium]
MQDFLGVAAFVVAAGGVLVVLSVLLGPFVRRQVVVLRLRRGLHQIEDVLAGWQQDLSDGRRSPYDTI